jgi:hypothetical protein
MLYVDRKAAALGGRKLGLGGAKALDIAAAGARSTLLEPGLWRISGNRELWFKQGGAAVAAAKDTDGSAYLAGGAIDYFVVTGDGDDYVHVIKGEDALDGKCSVTREEI